MSSRDWDCSVKSRTGAQITWNCENKNTGETKEIVSKLHEEKIFPEEDYEYEGEINGKEVEGSAQMGMGATKSIFTADSDEKLTDAEEAVGFAHIQWYF